jgi:hypothetical protein
MGKNKNQICKTLIIGLMILFAQITEANSKNSESIIVSKWEVVDIKFNTKGITSSPFEQEFGAIVTGPDNQKLNIPGFYNDNNEWVIRFSANKPGVWNYITYSNITALNGKTGKVAVTENTINDRHGAVVVNPENPQHFYSEDGTPYFTLAFELDWLFALDYENETEIPKTRTLFKHIKENNFNQVVMNVYAFDAKWGEIPGLKLGYNYEKPIAFPFMGSNDKPDFSSLNVQFFKKFDRVIQFLHEQNIVAHIMIYVWNKEVNWPTFGSIEDNRYFDYVVKRYQAFPNIIWDVSKEAMLYGRHGEGYIVERAERIRKLDAFDRLVTVHDYGFCKKYPHTVDFISTQDWKSDLKPRMDDVRKAFQHKPILNIEHGGYEEGPYLVFRGDYLNAETCLERNYECAFAGVYSTYYWQCAAWDVVIHDPFANNLEPKPKFEYYKHFTNLFVKYGFDKLKVPENPISTSGYCLTDGENVYLFYLPRGIQFFHPNLRNIFEKYKAIWYNPLTGEKMDDGIINANDGTWHDFTPPWTNLNVVLIAEKIK